MIHLPASVRVYLCLTACDMRKSFLQSHYLFAAKFGRPGKGNDKGNVEGLGYARAISWSRFRARQFGRS